MAVSIMLTFVKLAESLSQKEIRLSSISGLVYSVERERRNPGPSDPDPTLTKNPPQNGMMGKSKIMEEEDNEVAAI